MSKNFLCFIAAGATLTNPAGISIFWDRKVPHAADQQVCGTDEEASQSANRIEGTQPISDSFTQTENCGSLLTSPAWSVKLDVASYFCSGF